MKKTDDLLALSEDAFTRLYAERVEPIFRAQEENRRAAMKTFQGRAVMTAVAAVATAALAWWLFADAMPVLFAGIGIGVGGFIFAYAPLQTVATDTKRQSLTAIAESIGCGYQLDAFEPQALATFNELRLLPGCDRQNFEDCFSGDHKGCAFAFYDGHLERRVKTKNGERWDTVFRGQLIRIAFPKKFLGTTIIRRDQGMFNFMQRWASSLQRVGLGDSRLEKAFEVYASDQVEARYLIHPVFMERLLELETKFQGKDLRGAFIEGDLLVAIEGGNKFEVGTMFAKLDDIGRARAIVGDITEIMRLIDAVLTAEQGVLPNETGPASPGPSQTN